MKYFDEIPFKRRCGYADRGDRKGCCAYTKMYDRDSLYINAYHEKLAKEGGHLGNPDTAMFYELCFCTRGVIIELGSGNDGDGGYLIGKAISHSGHGTHYYTVDSHKQLAAQAARHAVQAAGKVRIFAKPIIAKSWDAPDIITEVPSLVFVDASHAQEDVRRDIKAWKDRILPGRLFVFHDLFDERNHDPTCLCYGVYQAVEKELLGDPEWVFVRAASTTGVFQRRDPQSEKTAEALSSAED